jgi:xanthosine utilization system XapX-like protein
MKLLYKPFGLVLGIVGGLLGKQLFDYVWRKLDDQEAPEATTKETTWTKVLAAAAVEGIAFKATRAAIDRFGAKGFYYLTGSWPGEERPPADE